MARVEQQQMLLSKLLDTMLPRIPHDSPKCVEFFALVNELLGHYRDMRRKQATALENEESSDDEEAEEENKIRRAQFLSELDADEKLFDQLATSIFNMIKAHPVVETSEHAKEDKVLRGLLSLLANISKSVSTESKKRLGAPAQITPSRGVSPIFLLGKARSSSNNSSPSAEHRPTKPLPPPPPPRNKPGAGLIEEIFHKCLFEIPSASNHGRFSPPKCKTKSTRNAAFDLLLHFANESPENHLQVLLITIQ